MKVLCLGAKNGCELSQKYLDCFYDRFVMRFESVQSGLNKPICLGNSTNPGEVSWSFNIKSMSYN